MFKKKPQIKNLSPLRSSDRRKLADQIISDYHVQIPTPQSSEAAEQNPKADAIPQPTLTTIRSSLLPDNTSSARFTTTSGPQSTPVSGTIYVGAHPGQEERILWWTASKDGRLLPTIYTLWHNPNLIPLLHAADFVVEEKLKAGADLMTPGLFKAKGRKWDSRATKGSIVAAASVTNDTVPVWVGQCEIDLQALPDDLKGSKGVAVKGLHWEGDELWAWSGVGKNGRPAPTSIQGWDGLLTGLETGTKTLAVDDEDLDTQEDGGVAVNKPGDGQPEEEKTQTNGEDEEQVLHEPTTQEVDDAFLQAFLYSLYTAKKDHQPPNYGLDLPIQASFLISKMIQPHLRYQHQHYNIKKTSWKNAKKFIKYLDKQLLVKSKDRNGGETVILDVDFNDQQVKAFQPYKLPKPKPKTADDPTKGNPASNGGDSSLGQSLNVQILYRASSKLVPELLPSKTVFYTAPEITAALKSYIEANPELTNGVSISRNVRLNPFIANNILGSNSSSSDQAALRAGEIDRGQLNRRIIDDDHLCNPYHIIVRDGEMCNPNDGQSSSASKPKPGPAPKVQIAIQRSTGSKLCTKVSGLEAYYINPHTLAPELQKKCAGSASVGQVTGGKPGLLEITIQGDQSSILVKDVLAKRGIKSQWMEVVDKVKKSKK